MNPVDILWQTILEELNKHVAKSSFDMWFKDLKPLSIENNVITLEAKSALVKDWINENFLFKVSEIATSVAGAVTKIKLVTKEDLYSRSTYVAPVSSSIVDTELEYGMLLDKYTFDKFVVGEGNRFSHAASIAVADAPGESYNPLFIYGKSGLGKTHLLQAIGHHARESYPSLKTVYISSEKFMNEFIDAIGKNKNEQFRQKYREVDILLIDDIQFIANKEKTQEEFFHTFNSLYEAGKQIVLTSDKPPSEIKPLEDRLRTRFSWGLITDILKPDLETRVAILRNKSHADGTEISNDVLELIASSVDSNVRDLEGALTRVIAYSTIMNTDIDEEFAKEALKNIVNANTEKKITIPDIKKIVSIHYQVNIEDFKSKSRAKNIAFPRQIAMYLSRECTDISFPKIGVEFGGRDHTTVMHAYEKISALISKDKHFRQQIETLIKSLKNV